MKLSLEQQPVAGSENSSGPEENQTPSPLGEPCSQTQAQEAAPRSPGCNTDLEAKQRPNSSSVTLGESVRRAGPPSASDL